MGKKRIAETIPEAERYKTLRNGAIYDRQVGRIVAMQPAEAEVNTQITQAKAGELQQIRREQKRARLLAGAARTLEATGDWSMPTDLDVVEAIGEAVAVKALDPDNVKQVDAARFLLQESGLAEAQQAQQQAQPSVRVDADQLMRLVQMLDAEAQARAARAQAVDAVAVDARADDDSDTQHTPHHVGSDGDSDSDGTRP